MILMTPMAKRFLEDAGGAISGNTIEWPDGTELVDARYNGGFGSFNYREWMLPTGECIYWSSDNSTYAPAYKRDPLTRQVIKSNQIPR